MNRDVKPDRIQLDKHTRTAIRMFFQASSDYCANIIRQACFYKASYFLMYERSALPGRHGAPLSVVRTRPSKGDASYASPSVPFTSSCSSGHSMGRSISL
jgi:hypothetical protein